MYSEKLAIILSNTKYPGYIFHQVEKNNLLFIFATYTEEDIITGNPSVQKTRKWYISQFAVPSEVVQTLFKCVITSMEHRTREHFKYKGERIFGPHFNVESLVDIAREKRLEYRK